LTLFFYNFLLYFGKKGSNLPFSIHSTVTSGTSYFSNVFAKKGGQLAILDEKEEYQNEPRGFNEALGTKERGIEEGMTVMNGARLPCRIRSGT